MLRVNPEQGRSIKFFTLGCKVNQYETQSIRERFLNNGYREVINGELCQVCLINTCSVTAAADRKSKNTIRRCIKNYPGARIIVTGCMVEKDNLCLSHIKGINYIISKRFFPGDISDFYGHTRVFLKVQDGCNNFCTYCKVCLIRGRSQSRRLDEVIAEARGLVQKGYQEIVLAGICLGAYGQDLKPEVGLSDILDRLKEISGLKRIRLSSIEAWDITDELIDRLKTNRKICPHLHIPVQSGDDEILRNMNRRINRRGYWDVLTKLRNARPDIAISTDVIVGFPGERKENFQATCELIKEIEPLKVHIFPYSPRAGTPAFELKDKTNFQEIKDRVLQLKDIARICSFNYRSRFINQIAQILIEGNYKKVKGYVEGLTDNYIKVLIKTDSCSLPGELVKVKLKKVDREFMLGQLL
jgi:threonylcarbamoyladenosine tRNA methylthiotransferase MtaB